MTSQYNGDTNSTTIDPNNREGGSVIDQSNNLPSSSSSSLNHSHFQKPQVSNLTKNLLSSSGGQTTPVATNVNSNTASNQQNLFTNTPSSYTEPITNRVLPNLKASASQMSNSFSGSFHQSHVHNHNDSINYIPSSHNTPTAVSSSYTSHHSYPASLSSVNNFISQPSQQQQQQHIPLSFKPPGVVPNSIPTTNVHNDTANRFSSVSSTGSPFSNSPFATSTQFQSPASIAQPVHPSSLQQVQQQRFPNSFPNTTVTHFPNPPNLQQSAINRTQHNNNNHNHHHHHQQQPIVTDTSVSTSGSTTPVENQRPAVKSVQSTPSLPHGNQHDQSARSSASSQSFQTYVQPEPDHYMTYSEFLHNLSVKDSQDESAAYEEHLNIVEYPVNDLIVMLSCLLTKIIEANDKLHPNHFENTIAIRQRLKEEKRLKKLQRQNKLQSENDDAYDEDDIDVDRTDRSFHGNNDGMDQDDDSNANVQNNDNIDNDDEEEDDDEDDEMKNKYLANVLAFHGTNIPGISLQSYLGRVLKYCPVTNEVFLSLLVYFDRIAKKANNLNQKKKNSNSNGNSTGGTGSDNQSSEAEQLFVMDSYNIHRLIISGITVSSKFFSDIFYKNLRYAKVGGLPLEELNYLELQFLLLLDFKLMISVEDLQNYGDLLLRFWKREQIANELVPNNNDNETKEHQTQTQS
ncbi:hypothetical protein MGQ_00655 [Candida albicans P76067]|nr:hypothetical protein MGQ_00655 [Candida albicans P76067]